MAHQGLHKGYDFPHSVVFCGDASAGRRQIPKRKSSNSWTLSILAFSATAGTAVEYYDFFIFGFAAATVFPKLFFPDLSYSWSLALSYVAYGAGFPARLLGSFIFGHFGDRIGRRWSFLITFLMVGLSTCLTGLLPGAATLGLAAPLLLVGLRVIQGIGLGGEFGGATALLAEYGAGFRHRALWVALANIGIPGGAMAASLATYLLSADFAGSGWRVAMLGSAILFVPAAIARYRLGDSPQFEKARNSGKLSRAPSLAVLRSHSRPILRLALLSAFQQMDGYVSGTYMISFMTKAGIPLSAAAVAIFVGRIGDVGGVALGGYCAGRLPRRMLAAIGVLATTVLSVPFVLAILDRNMVLVGFLQFLITLFGVGVLHALAPIIASETFETRHRYSGAGISFNFSAMLGGMIPPSLLAGLIGAEVEQRWYYVPVLYAVYCVIALISLCLMRETAGVRLENLAS